MRKHQSIEQLHEWGTTRKPHFNGPPLSGEAKPPTPVKFDALETLTIAERIARLQKRVFTADYRMTARPTPPA
jgi:hypothetical protein